MAKVLFVKANDRPAEQAVSVKMYDAFLSAYKESHPQDQITELDLYALNLPHYGNETITGTFKVAQGLEATAEEKKAAELADQYLDQFLGADKIVIAYPLWNFSIPSPLVTYIGFLARAGKTFKYTPEGPVGLAGDKKVALLNARGGVYSAPPMDGFEMAHKLVKANLGFWGITNTTDIIIEGHAANPGEAQNIIAEGLRRTAEAASNF